MRAALVAALAGLAVAAGACGSTPSTFPDESECPAPAPLPTSRAAAGVVSAQAYVRRVQDSATNLEKLRSDLRAKYSEDTFYRREEFRPDFAQYASLTVCTAQAMFNLEPPDARFAAYDSALDTLLEDLIAHTRAGREAVRSRNVSDYRDWYAGVDEKISTVRLAASASGQ